MSGSDAPPDTAVFLAKIAEELTEIRRGSDYSLWRDEAKHRVNRFLSQKQPFSEFANCWVFSGDGAGSVMSGRLGEWAIDRLLEKRTPEEIIACFEEEVGRSGADYEDVSPVLGLKITETCELSPGIRIVPPASDVFDVGAHSYRFAWPIMPTGTGFLVQAYSVEPAFEQRPADATGPIGTSVTQAPSAVRDEVRRRVRLACLLGSSGGVELPMSVIVADKNALFAVGGSIAARPLAPQPLVGCPADLAVIKRAYEQLAAFADGDSLARATDRLGRSRLAVHPVDRALDLGMAAEIVLMHDQSRSNTEITHKIASRAAWLLGGDPCERAEVFAQVKQLYAARSTAVHSGVLQANSKVDLNRADALVSRAIQAILDRGRFPDWMSLTLGGS